MEFLSETNGGEYSDNESYPYGKWYFYEQILQVPYYVIFSSVSGELEVHHLENGRYVSKGIDESGRYWLAPLNLYLGIWYGERLATTTHWLRFWDVAGEILPWGDERAETEREMAKAERERAEVADKKTEVANERVETLEQELTKLKARLRIEETL